MNANEQQKIIQKTEQTLLAYCKRQGLFKAGDRVIAACSGGADSMALLLFLLRRKRDLEIEVLATHVDRGISLPPHPFFRGFLNFFGAQLHHFSLNTITYLAAFVSMCEN